SAVGHGREGVQVLDRQQGRIGVGVVDGAVHRRDRLGLAFGHRLLAEALGLGHPLDGRRLALGPQDLLLLVALGPQDHGLLLALRSCRRRLPLPPPPPCPPGLACGFPPPARSTPPFCPPPARAVPPCRSPSAWVTTARRVR